MTQPDGFLKAALEYLEAGLSVIPLKGKHGADVNDSKRPLIESWKPYQDRPPTRQEIETWAAKWPLADVGIITGPISRKLVLDIDPHHDGKKSIEGKHIPPTWTANTPRGGHHYFYKWTPELDGIEPTSVNGLLPGVDVKGAGGYVGAPGGTNGRSWVEGLSWKDTELAPPPSWLIEDLKSRGQKVKCGNPPGWISAALEGMKEGNRNETFTKIVGRLHRDGHDKTDILSLLSPHATRLQFPNDELARIVESIGKKPAKPTDILERIKAHGSIPILRPGQDFHDGKLYYGIAQGKDKYLICSDGTLETMETAGGRFKINAKDFYRSAFSPDGIGRFKAGASVSGGELWKAIVSHLERFVIFQDEHTPRVLALWALASYLYSVFQWFAYPWINSASKSCGKSILLSLLGDVSFNPAPTSSNSSQSWLFREIAGNGGTILLDEVESLRGQDREKYGDLMAILNDGFRNGGAVGRVETIGKEYIPTSYPVYGPKILAGISELADTVASRCLKIVMRRKKPAEKAERYIPRNNAENLSRLRDDCHNFALRNAPKIASLYEHIDASLLPDMDDRLRDILEPLATVALIVAEDGFKGALASLQAFAQTQAELRRADEGEDDKVIAALEVLLGLAFDERGRAVLNGQELADLFTAHDALAWVENKASRASAIIRLLGFRSQPNREGDKVRRGYAITKDKIDDLAERYKVARERP